MTDALLEMKNVPLAWAYRAAASLTPAKPGSTLRIVTAPRLGT